MTQSATTLLATVDALETHYLTRGEAIVQEASFGTHIGDTVDTDTVCNNFPNNNMEWTSEDYPFA